MRNKQCFLHSIILTIVIFFSGVGQVNGQSYFNTAGVRIGNGSNYRTAGITYQQKILKDFTIEGIAQTDFSKNSTLHALCEYHRPIISKRLNYYMGAGLMTGKETSINPETKTAIKSAVFGADLVAGVELTLLKFTISLDYKPNFNITGREKWFQDQIGVSARAVLLSGKQWQKIVKAHQKEKAKKLRQERRNERIANRNITSN